MLYLLCKANFALFNTWVKSSMNTKFLNLNQDSFSDGQMRSKIWLSEKVAAVADAKLWPRLVVYGSWYGLLPFVLKLRADLDFKKLILCDLDQESLDISRQILNHWICQGLEVETICADCNNFPVELRADDFIMNTSCEHIDSTEWWRKLPAGIQFALQSTNMEHPTHIRAMASLAEWKKDLGPIQEISYEGSLFFSYPDKDFHRWMIIGKK